MSRNVGLSIDTQAAVAAETLFSPLSPDSRREGSAGSLGDLLRSFLRLTWNDKRESLASRFRAGTLTGVVCVTSESETGFWVCLVVDVQPAASATDTCLLQLAQLRPRDPQQDGMVGCRYEVCSDEVFWEQETRLLPAQLVASQDEYGREYFCLMSDVARLVRTCDDRGSRSSVDTTSMSSERAAERSVTALKIEQPQDRDNLASPLVVYDLPTYEAVVDKCDELVKTVLDLCARPDTEDASKGVPTWTPLSDDDGITVFERTNNTGPYACFMARCMIPASPAEIKFLVKHSKNREQYDPMCRSVSLIQTIDESTTVVSVLNRKFGMTREFVFMRHARSLPDGTSVIASNTVETSLCPISSYTRGHVLPSGFSMRPVPSERGTSLVSYILQTNLDTWAPNAMVKYILKTQVRAVLQTIRDYYVRRVAAGEDPAIAHIMSGEDLHTLAKRAGPSRSSSFRVRAESTNSSSSASAHLQNNENASVTIDGTPGAF